MRLAAAFVLLAALAGCGEPARELARGPAGTSGPRVLLDSLATRFGPIQREPAFDALRPKLARAALSPSRLFDDPAAWTTRHGDSRSLELVAPTSRFGYRMGVRDSVPDPARPAEYRERVQLRRIGSGRFEWDVDEALATGEVRPDDLAAAFTALLREAEGRDSASARAAYATSLPRTTAVLRALFRVERLELARDATGATRIELAVRLTPAGIRGFAPRYAEFLRKYMTPMTLKAVALDASNMPWWRLDAADNLWSLRLRVRDGSLVPLAGAADRGIPGELRIVADYDTKMGIFGVGVKQLVAQVALTRSPLEKGVALRFRDEPQWHLPFLVAPLIRGSLRYPFEGPGSEVVLAARAGPGRATLLTGRYRARVRESWLVRWMGGLTSNALSEFRRGAEDEADRYLRDSLLALRDDVAALAAS